MNKIIRWFLSAVFICLFLFSSCSKKKEQEKLVGSWDMIFLLASEQNKKVVWTFKDDNSLTFTDYRTDSTYIFNSNYLLTKEFPSTFYIDITGIESGQDINGRYQIIKLNKKILTIERVLLSSGTKPGAYLWKEFVRINQ